MSFHDRGFLLLLLSLLLIVIFSYAFISFFVSGKKKMLMSNFRKARITKAVSHKSSFTLQCPTSLYSRFSEQHSKAEMTFPGWLPSRVCAVGYHVSHERRRRRRRQSGWPTTGRINRMCAPTPHSPSLLSLSWRSQSQDQGSGSPHCSHRQGFTIGTNVDKLCSQRDCLSHDAARFYIHFIQVKKTGVFVFLYIDVFDRQWLSRCAGSAEHIQQSSSD